jgi:hypothetical protein
MNEPQISSNVEVVNARNAETVTLPPPDAPRSPLCVYSFGLTDIGKVRATNEDQFLIAVLLKALHVERTSLPQAGAVTPCQGLRGHFERTCVYSVLSSPFCL